MRTEQMEELQKEIELHYGNIAGIMVSRNNQVLWEHSQNGYSVRDKIHVASVTKSIISLLIGIAMDRGYIKSVDQRVLSFFPEYRIKRGERCIQKITLKHLLTMTAPYKFKSEPYTRVFTSGDWTKAALDLLGGKGQIGDFKYSTVGLQALSGILVQATGQSVLDFAEEQLFAPLGIKGINSREINNREEYLAFLKERGYSGWVVDPQGIHTAGWGLTLSTEDMVKLGQLYAQRGRWKHQSIISSEWIEESITKHSQWGDRPYGYLWWIIKAFKGTSFAALGDGGNVIFIDPREKLVVTIASTFMPRARDRLELIRKIQSFFTQ